VNYYEKNLPYKSYLYQRNAHHLQQCKGDIGLLLEYNRDRLYDRYEKWKAREKNYRQIIFAL
jgi:hypothetical protein